MGDIPERAIIDVNMDSVTAFMGIYVRHHFFNGRLDCASEFLDNSGSCQRMGAPFTRISYCLGVIRATGMALRASNLRSMSRQLLIYISQCQCTSVTKVTHRVIPCVKLKHYQDTMFRYISRFSKELFQNHMCSIQCCLSYEKTKLDSPTLNNFGNFYMNWLFRLRQH